MENVNLSKYGVEKLRPTELKKITGGSLFRPFPPVGLGAIAFQIESIKSFLEGYNDATK